MGLPIELQRPAFNKLMGSGPLVKICEFTGFTVPQLWKLEQVLDLKDQPSEIRHILATSKVPSGREILIRLFLSKNAELGKRRSASGTLKTRVTKHELIVNTVHGKLQLKGRLYLEFKKRWMGKAVPRARIRISCKLLDDEKFCEFHQEILLFGQNGFRVRNRTGKFITKTAIPITIAKPVRLNPGI